MLDIYPNPDLVDYGLRIRDNKYPQDDITWFLMEKRQYGRKKSADLLLEVPPAELKPDLTFDEQGVCNACTNYEDRSYVDWSAREKEFLGIVELYRSQTHRPGTLQFR